MSVFRVIVCGSREIGFHAAVVINDRLALLPSECVMVHGGAPGVDSIAHQVAPLSVVREVHRPDYNTHGSVAPFVRNTKMASLGAHLCIAFWNGESRGTQHMMEEAKKKGIEVELIPLP